MLHLLLSASTGQEGLLYKVPGFLKMPITILWGILTIIIAIWPLIAIGAIIFIIVKVRKRKNKKD